MYYINDTCENINDTDNTGLKIITQIRVSVDVWRQRIGTFSMPSAKRKRESPWRLGIGIGTFWVIVASVTLGLGSFYLHSCFARFSTLLTFGDVELNPGPDNLSDQILKQLQNEDYSFEPLPFPLANKHVVQLNKLKPSMAKMESWLKALLPSFPAEGDWTRRIRNHTKSLMLTHQKLQKTTSKEAT